MSDIWFREWVMSENRTVNSTIRLSSNIEKGSDELRSVQNYLRMVGDNYGAHQLEKFHDLVSLKIGVSCCGRGGVYTSLETCEHVKTFCGLMGWQWEDV